MKKKILLIGYFIALIVTSQAQIELRINPLGFISNFHLSSEISASEHFGVEPFIGTGWIQGQRLRISLLKQRDFYMVLTINTTLRQTKALINSIWDFICGVAKVKR
jgi:hypothetical protein